MADIHVQLDIFDLIIEILSVQRGTCLVYGYKFPYTTMPRLIP